MQSNSITTEPIISIGTLAEKLNVSVSTLRKYEAEGLLISHRTESGHRLFSVEDIDRVKKIQYMIQDVGLNIEGIRRMQAMLPCWDIRPCTEDEKKVCPAYSDKSKPCWMNKVSECGNDQIETCRTCIVYRVGSQSVEEIKDFVCSDLSTKDLKKKFNAMINKNHKKEEK